MASEGVLNIRVPRELESRVIQLAAELGVKKSTAARLLLRRALDEPIGLAVIKEKVMDVHAMMRERQAELTRTLRDAMLAMLDDIAPEEEAVPSLAEEAQVEQMQEHFLPTEPRDPILEDDEENDWAAAIPVDHGISGVRKKSTGDARGRRKRS